VHRDDYLDYLRRYSLRERLRVRSGVCVERVEGESGNFRLVTSEGVMISRVVVIATGHDHAPNMPDWPGAEAFSGRLLHSDRYRRTAPFEGQTVLVVGSGNSGMEIALDLAEGGAAAVQLAVRKPPILLAHEWHHIPVSWWGLAGQPAPPRLRDVGTRLLSRAMFGNLESIGLPQPRRGMTEQLRLGRLPTIDKGTVAAIKRGAIEVVPSVERFEGAEVVLASGRRLRPDVVIAATGYRPALEPLVGHLGAVDEDGNPRASAVRGLFFIGYRVPLSGPLAQYRCDAPRLARAVASELHPI
jgi:putative flavoprotein involved in K+ transport